MLNRDLPALDVGLGDRDRELIDILAVNLAGIARFIDAQLSARDGAFHLRTRRAVIGEKIAFRERLVAGLIMHVLAAGRECEERKRAGAGEKFVATSQRQPPPRG